LADDHEKAITAIKQVRALDKKAENARELGLDYGPVTTLFGSLPVYDTPPVQEPVAALDRIKEALPEFRQQDDYLLAHGASLLSEHSHEIIHIDTALRIAEATPPATFVQEPVAWSDTKQSELNDWFLSLPTERQAVLLEDKWMLAGAAFLAGKTTPPAAQRQWVGLTVEDKLTVRRMPWETLGDLMDNTETKLKEKNT
jgi:hypothetical protein